MTTAAVAGSIKVNARIRPAETYTLQNLHQNRSENIIEAHYFHIIKGIDTHYTFQLVKRITFTLNYHLAPESRVQPNCAMNLMKYIIVSGLLVASVHVAWAQSAPPESTGTAAVSPPKQIDRSQYNPSNPTPSDEMRAFRPDRPYVTDSPYTVDPGHWLLEAGLFEYTRDRYTSDDMPRLDSFAFGDMEVRLGVTSYAEAEALFIAYTYMRTKDKITGAQLKQSGFSDFTLRFKFNILGNDGGRIAIALIPFVVFPTGADGIGNRGFSGGVVLPVEFALPADFHLRAASTIQTIHEPGGGSHFDYINSAALGHPITKKLSTYIELWTDISTEAHQSWVGTVDTGLIYQLANNWELDAGVNIGVTKAAHDLFSFIGAAWRY